MKVQISLVSAPQPWMITALIPVSATPQSGWPATLNQPITRTQKDRQPIKTSAPLILYKLSFVYCCLARRLFSRPFSAPIILLHVVLKHRGRKKKVGWQLIMQPDLSQCGDGGRMHCLVLTKCHSQLVLSQPGPSEAAPPACSPVTQKACESGRQKNKLTLCPAAHLGSNGRKSVCMCVLQVWALVGCVRGGWNAAHFVVVEDTHTHWQNYNNAKNRLEKKWLKQI